jgi:hypothetical protein
MIINFGLEGYESVAYRFLGDPRLLNMHHSLRYRDRKFSTDAIIARHSLLFYQLSSIHINITNPKLLRISQQQICLYVFFILRATCKNHRNLRYEMPLLFSCRVRIVECTLRGI